MASYIGLYYPFMHFKDEAWLKLTILYWDKIARILPPGYETDDQDDVKRLIDEGFVRNYAPGNDVQVTGQLFLDLLRKSEWRLKAIYTVSQRDTWPPVPAYMRAPLGGPSDPDPRLGYILLDKMSTDLQFVLLTTGLGMHHLNEMWIGLHPRLAFVYMTALAEQMARTRSLHPLTNETFDHLAITGCTLERLTHALLGWPLSPRPVLTLNKPVLTENEIESHLAMISFQLIVPKDIEHVPIEKIITLRKRHAGELARLQQCLHEFVSTEGQLLDVKDPVALLDHLENEYTKKLRPELEALKNQLRWLNLDTVTGVMNVSLDEPKLMTSAAALAGITVLNPLVAAAGAVAFAVLKIIKEKGKNNKQALKDSPTAYLLHAERELKPQKLLSWVPEHAHRFGFPQ